MKILLEKQIYLDTLNVSELEVSQCDVCEMFGEFTVTVLDKIAIIRYSADVQSIDEIIEIFEKHFNKLYRRFLLSELIRLSDKISSIKNKISERN